MPVRVDPNYESGVLVTREQCPRCREQGRDNAKDNLAVYRDGHKYCYSCNYCEIPKLDVRIHKALNPEPQLKVVETSGVQLPDDFTYDLSKEALTYLRSYGIQDWEITTNSIGWSPSLQRIIYPVYGDDPNEVVMWSGRAMSSQFKPKYLTKGPASDILHIITHKNSSYSIIVVEDLLSAIKVGRIFNCMPLWGCNLPLKTILRLKDRFSVLGIWLDPDKRLESVKLALRASQYMKTFVVQSDVDPKELITEKIVEHIDIAARDLITKDETIDKST